MAKVKKGEIDRWTTDGAGLVITNKKETVKKKEPAKKSSAKKRGK